MKKLTNKLLSKWMLPLVIIGMTFNSFGTKISGTVTDEKGRPIFNAYVSLVKANSNQDITVTNYLGIYEMNAPAGTYFLRATYFGKDTFQKEIVIGNSPLIKNFVMLPKAGKKKVVTVRGKRNQNSEESVLLKRKIAGGVVEGMSKEQFSKTGDGNVTQGVKRITGVTIEEGKFVTVRGMGDRYTKGLLNGSDIPSPDAMKNSVQMDIFPANIIDNVMIYKSFTPNLPGDFSGGLVDVITRGFPEKKTFSLSLSGSFNPNATNNSNFMTYDGGKLDFLGIDDGTRDLPAGAENIPDRYMPGNIDVAKSFKNNWTMKTKTPFLNTSISSAFGNSYKFSGKQFGFVSALSYAHSSSRIENGFIGRWSVPSALASENLNEEKLYKFDKSKETAIWTAMVGNTVRLNKRNTMGLNVVYSHNGSKESKVLEGEWFDQPAEFFVSQAQLFKERSFTSVQLFGRHTLSDSSKLKMSWSSAFTTGKQNNPDNRYFQYEYDVLEDGSKLFEMNTNYSEPTRLYQKMDENSLDNKVHFTMPFKFKKIYKSSFKFGGAYSIKTRDFVENRYDFPDGKGSLLSEVNGDLNRFFDHSNADVTSGWYVEDGSELRNSYDAMQQVVATYGMFDVAINNKLKMITGARVEAMNLEVESADKNKKKGTLDKVDVLPSLLFKYILNKKTRIRMGYGRTVARPSFREIAPFTTFSFDQPPVKGNPELDRTLIDNFDLRWETYPNKGEIVLLSLFYKSMNSPIGQAYVPQAANAEIQMVNLADAKVFGVEFEIRKNFSQVIKKGEKFNWLRNFNFGFNTSYVHSVSKIDKEEYLARKEVDATAKETRPLFGQSPYVVNGFVGYKNDSLGLSINASYNVFGKRLLIASQGALPDIYEQSRPSLDIVANQVISKRFRMSFKAKNILNPENKLSHEFKGKEFVYSSFKTGSSFSLGLSYKF